MKTKAILLIAGLLMLPVLVVPSSWPVAVFLAGVWLVFAYGVSYVLDLEKYRRSGERSAIIDSQNRRKRRKQRDR